MKVLIHLGHPAQFHLYKNVAKNLINKGHSAMFMIKTKDILEDLVKESGLPYLNILPVAHRKSKVGVLFDLFLRDWRILKYCIVNKIDLLTGSTVEVAHVSWLTRTHSINTAEDDASVVPLFYKLAGRFIQTVVTPISCECGKYEHKSVKYAGFHKLAYLHPNQFTADAKVVEKYFSADKPYFLLRFAELRAYHDGGVGGINTVIAQKLIDILSKKGIVYITSERKLEPQFEKYRLNINLLDIHHIMAYADLYIGDSQSMAVEAAMLGTPSLRFNDFAGKIGVLEELENKYNLTYGISTSEPEKLYTKVEELLATPNLKEEFAKRRKTMLADKIDVTAFFTWFIENYPESKQIMKDNPDYQYKFK